jgi:hypothetical protein
MKNVWVSRQPVLPGVWQRKEGGHVVRGRATDSKTGKQVEIFRTLPDANEQTALKWLRDEQARIRAGVDDSPEKPRQRFAVFAASLFEHKVKVRGCSTGYRRSFRSSAGTVNRRNMIMVIPRRTSARLELRLRSYSLLRILNLPNHAFVRSTTQRLGSTAKP